ncbi:hypothetical protein [Sphingomonas parapaucimobilis]|uniref:phosphorylase family protein n=1 Tax=Sphingomonas parapaucimobilis TaxID=28213 RepID=UPI0035C7E836
MKILIVDDSNDKTSRVVSCILESTSVRRGDIDVAFTILDAKQKLRETVYDLMILDVVVPLRAGDPARSENSEALLVELRDRAVMKKPRQIIGLTAYEAEFRALRSAFQDQSWVIIRFEEGNSEWSEQIARSVRYLERVSSERATQAYKTDVVIISALESPEHDAVRRNGWEWSAPEPLDDTTFYQKAHFRSGDREFSAAAAYCPRMGMVAAALLSAKLIEALRPRYLVMPGICAGVKGRANYGDVIIADPCWDWQVGKHLVKDGITEFAIQPEQLNIPATLRAKWDQLRVNRSIWSAVKDGWRDPPESELKVRVGPSVSGSSVLADPAIVDHIKQQHRSLMAVEMEGFGVFAAAQAASSPRPVAFTCKAVCDFADEKKDDRWQSYAAYTSASGMTKFFELYMDTLA